MSYTTLILSSQAATYAELLAPYDLPDLTLVTAENTAEAHPFISTCEIIFGAPGLIREILPQAAQLQWVQSTWAGVEALLKPELRQDYLLTNVKGIFGDLMAEYVIGYLLLHERHMLAHYAAQQAGRWHHVWPGMLRGKTMGILGVGSIGAAVAETAKHFGMRTYGYTRSSMDCAFVDQYFHGSLLEFVAEVDYLVCTLPHTAANEHLIDRTVLQAMKPTAVLINGGRGSAIDEAALLIALQQNEIALAVLDVFQREPLPPEHPFWAAPNLLMTSHTAAPTLPELIVPIFAENYRRFVNKQPLNYQVEFGRGY